MVMRLNLYVNHPLLKSQVDSFLLFTIKFHLSGTRFVLLLISFEVLFYHLLKMSLCSFDKRLTISWTIEHHPRKDD
uniref:Uncharacterized protein n=1 Tax=Rhizophora mucronata TaxID=61149 RepID=A0A2P2P513_RHIMU